jgi:hypothetical protein
MRINIGGRRFDHGSTLVVTLITCSILAITAIGYLALIEHQGKLSRRSQSWNMSIGVVEAGIEDALQHLNSNFTNLASDGWTATADFYWKTNAMDGGNGYYARIYNTNIFKPVIISQASTPPYTLAYSGTPGFFAAIGYAENLRRAVRIHAKKGSLFIRALAAKDLIDMTGNNILTDSFDSGDPNWSGPGGQYDPTKTRDYGDVASNGKLINVGNANIYGHAATGPGGTIAVGSGGGIGPHSWQATHVGQIADGWATDDSNFTFPDTSLPYTTGLTAEPGDIVESELLIISNSVTSDIPPLSMPWGGVKSNVLSTTEMSSLPDPIPLGTTTNVDITTTSFYPSPIPLGGVITNTAGTTTTTKYPTGVAGPISTNLAGTATVVAYPNPPPVGLVTNTVFQKEKTYYPAAGTYVGSVVTNGVNYSWNEIVSYSYPVLAYTYYNYTYTYKVYTYVVPTAYSFTYNNYTTNTIYKTNHYDHIFQSGEYVVDTLSGKSIVLGQASLVCLNGINMTGNDVLKIAKGGSMTNWVGGASITIQGSGVVNETGLAQNYVLYGDETVKTLSLGGNGSFTGILVAPEAVTNLNGGGGAGVGGAFDIIGCVMVKSVKMNGHYSFHYDEALSRLPGTGRYLITSWDEIPPIL